MSNPIEITDENRDAIFGIAPFRGCIPFDPMLVNIFKWNHPEWCCHIYTYDCTDVFATKCLRCGYDKSLPASRLHEEDEVGIVNMDNSDWPLLEKK